MNKSKYYSLARLWSYNSYINIVMSNRGGGKTYAAADYIVQNWLKKKKQSAYVRRNLKELDDCKDQFWEDMKIKYPDLEFKVEGYEGYINGEIVVFFKSISTGSNSKSIPYPNVTFIVIDEYIPTKSTHTGRFLRNEMILTLDLIETFFRDRPEPQKVLILSNAVSYVCPLFSFFNIKPDPNKRFTTYKDGLICLEMFKSDEFIREKNKTPFGRLTKGTAYHNYAVNNEVLEDSNDYIKIKEPGKWKFLCEIKVENLRLGVWYNIKDYSLYVDNKIDKTSCEKYVIHIDDMTEGYFLIKDFRKTWRVQQIRAAFNNANVFYENQEIKKAFMDKIIKYI